MQSKIEEARIASENEQRALQETVHRLNADIAAITTHAESTASADSSLEGTVAGLRTSLQDATSDISALRAELATMTTDRDAAAAERDDARASVQTTLESTHVLEARFRECSEVNQELEAELLQYKTDFAASRNAMSAATAAVSDGSHWPCSCHALPCTVRLAPAK
eukprot:m.699986 g.699986  ORF g.699986 m.699986 type:complete len:166 (+) comp22908_c0_seq15:399-896(+)